jgi:hypothetical protein
MGKMVSTLDDERPGKRQRRHIELSCHAGKAAKTGILRQGLDPRFHVKQLA